VALCHCFRGYGASNPSMRFHLQLLPQNRGRP
jgi:hypothetical protein